MCRKIVRWNTVRGSACFVFFKLCQTSFVAVLDRNRTSVTVSFLWWSSALPRKKQRQRWCDWGRLACSLAFVTANPSSLFLHKFHMCKGFCYVFVSSDIHCFCPSAFSVIPGTVFLETHTVYTVHQSSYQWTEENLIMVMVNLVKPFCRCNLLHFFKQVLIFLKN